MPRFFKKFLPQSLMGRTLLIMILPILLAQIIAVYIFYERHWGNVSKHMALSLAGELAVIAKQVTANPDMDLSIYVDNLSIRSAKIGQFPKSRGLVWKKIKQSPYSSFLRSKIHNELMVYISIDNSLLLTRIKLDDKNWLEITTSNKRLFNSTTYIFIIWMIGSTTILTFVAALFLKNQIRPIIRLARSADMFGRGQDLPINFKPEGAYEVKTASQAFIKMQERIRRFIRQRTEMLAGISHDLRTPLTRLKLQIEMLRGKISEAEISEMAKDIKEMQEMIDSYINFVRSAEEEESREVNIAETLRDVVAKFKAQNADIELAKLSNHVLFIKENSITRAVSNLVSNALKYAHKARISTAESAEFYSIIVEDDGAGIPESERELVLRPFYRIENSRNPETGGSGLGLAIVQDIINSHGGTLELTDSADLGGLMVKINLPK
jgi:two-component system osmolarity sensor histidine kinase EnvZ